MSKKIVRYVYQGKEYIEECDKAAERVFKDRSEDELVRFNSLKKHSPKGQKRYLAGDPKNLVTFKSYGMEGFQQKGYEC